MVAVSLWLNRRYYPTPYDWRHITEYVAVGILAFFGAEQLREMWSEQTAYIYAVNVLIFMAYGAYLVRRERIDLRALVRSVLKR